jgi:3-deoxy-D-manno-octulosonic-acid transferase
MGLKDCHPIMIAGSTHKGEEELVISAYKQIRDSIPSAKLLIAPRDTLRAEEVANLATSHGLAAARRTVLLNNPSSAYDIVVLDTIGELGKIYSIGDIIYVGGSLIPHGGHNILEPAAHGKPILVGPHMFNFKDTYALFSGREACVTVGNAAELAEKTLYILNHEALRESMSREALAIMQENRGAAHKSALYLKAILEKSKIKLS